MNNGRDCPHGRQVGKCDTCDLIKTELELQQVTADRDALSLALSSYEKTMRELVTTHGLICAKSRQHYFERYAELSAVTPQHHLAAHDAEVAIAAGVAGLRHGVALANGMEINQGSILIEMWCKGYEEQLRAKAKP